ncbi:DUF4232 domain-containing protein [Streptomyces zingiberis]|uniref:DUF4232 domain-containing protein n=1 Tax=Streptomyces zingiberis TaxID=2053010 RepID=A0ABX1C2K7_9ACTN|nr:DUF4232 domain-containing protein [Streptomyces zingiberis]NJQ02915.1 DUF4232 domain-containing protein [Streptomyces zingiberis]
MLSIRNSRPRFLAAAATGVLAVLSLTACDDGSGVRDEGSAAIRTATTPDSPRSGAGSLPGEDARPASGGSKQAGDKTNGVVPASSERDGAGEGGDATAVTCRSANTRTVASLVRRPLNHLLLTVTNTGSRTCHLYTYPAVRFGEAQSVPPAIEESRPQAVVTLEPGESGYASVILSAADGSGSGTHTERSLSVHFFGADGGGSVGGPAHPELPAGGVRVDDTLKVSYWQASREDALLW